MLSFLEKTFGIGGRLTVHEISVGGDYAPKASTHFKTRNERSYPFFFLQQPFDLVLFGGSDPFIKKIELHELVPNLVKPFHQLWTHSGILVDKTVLPLDCLEDGKLYIYESVFSGRIGTIVYSKVLLVDRHVSEKSFHLGPQIRELVPVLAEGDTDVAICPLTNEARTILNKKLAANPNLLLEIHQKYYEFGYPIANPLRVIASVSEHIHKELAMLKTLRETLFLGIHKKKDQVFCSKLVALIYSQFGGSDGAFATFTSAPANTFLPLELKVASEFDGAVYYAKLDKIVWFKDGLINVDPHVTRVQKLLQAQKYHKNWKPVDAKTAAAEAAGLMGVPENVVEVGVDTDRKKVYVAH
ncbi:hypothetical protein HK100_007449, partial [Physocladia obscura]